MSIKFVVGSKELISQHMVDLMALEVDADFPKIWNKDNFLYDLDSKWIFSKLLFLEDQLIGVAIVSKKAPQCCHLHRFFVKKSYRNRGLGGAFLTELKRSVFKKAEYLTLFVNSKNNHAISFYNNNFFQEILRIDEDILMIARDMSKKC